MKKKHKYSKDMERAKEKGQEYFTPDQVRKMLCAQIFGISVPPTTPSNSLSDS